MSGEIINIKPARGKDMSGMTVGEWTVEKLEKTDARGRWFFCRCSCGVTRIVLGVELRRGKSKSCGHDGPTFKHGHKRRSGDNPPEYNVWAMMRNRCNNPASKDYKNYGGRGISVCPRWESFVLFLNDMGARPSPRHTIDRIDNGGNYGPLNCRWATFAEQRRNSRRTINVTIDGETMCLKDWCRRLGVPYGRIFNRISRGLSPLEALRGKEV